MAFWQSDDFLGINAKIKLPELVKMYAFGHNAKAFAFKKRAKPCYVTKNSLDTGLDLE